VLRVDIVMRTCVCLWCQQVRMCLAAAKRNVCKGSKIFGKGSLRCKRKRTLPGERRPQQRRPNLNVGLFGLAASLSLSSSTSSSDLNVSAFVPNFWNVK